MSTPWFFLSYSSTDDEEGDCVIEFYNDLVKEVRRKGALKGLPDDKIGFLDGASLEVGDEFDRAIEEALRTSRTLVCLYSPNYFESKYCLKELKIFQSRLAGYKNDADPQRRPHRIFPVLWESPATLSAALPTGISGIQNKDKDLGDEYAKKGLLFLRKMKREAEYKNFLDNFADKLVREAKEGFLPPPPLPTPGWPLWLKILTASVAVLATGFIIWRAVHSTGAVTPKPAPTPTPAATPTPFTDLFRPAKTDGSTGSRWDGSNAWFIPEQWDYFSNSPLAGWLLVKGTQPGAVKGMKFGDSIIKFRVESTDKSKPATSPPSWGWMLHAEADASGVSGGYCFRIERPTAEGLPFKFSAYDCRTGEKIPSDKNEVGITQYGKKKDFIQVEAIVENNKQQLYFSLHNYEESDDPSQARGNTRQCYPVLITGKPDLYPDGSVGFFAVDGAGGFSVSKFEVYPLTDANRKLVQCH
jgi:hypothetical protein